MINPNSAPKLSIKNIIGHPKSSLERTMKFQRVFPTLNICYKYGNIISSIKIKILSQNP